jgi:hypothetical protein
MEWLSSKTINMLSKVLGQDRQGELGDASNTMGKGGPIP